MKSLDRFGLGVLVVMVSTLFSRGMTLEFENVFGHVFAACGLVVGMALMIKAVKD